MKGKKNMRPLRSLNRVETWLVIILMLVIAFVTTRWQPDDHGDWSIPAKAKPAAPARNGDIRDGKAVAGPGKPVRFMFYNVRNYFMSDLSPHTGRRTTVKPESSRRQVVELIGQAAPDIVGLAEIGGADALGDLRLRLKRSGLDFPHAYVLMRPGEDRSLAVLSRYPLCCEASRADVPLEGPGKRRMLRGILDVSVNLPDGRIFRLVGVHLKSKKDTDGTADSVRRMEAHALRRHLDQTRSPVPVVVFGDFNDGPDSPAIHAAVGDRRSPGGLRRVVARDSRRESWTLHYGEAEAYFSYDHLLLDGAMSGRVGRSPSCGIVESHAHPEASDHRAIWIDLK